MMWTFFLMLLTAVAVDFYTHSQLGYFRGYRAGQYLGFIIGVGVFDFIALCVLFSIYIVMKQIPQ